MGRLPTKGEGTRGLYAICSIDHLQVAGENKNFLTIEDFRSDPHDAWDVARDLKDADRPFWIIKVEIMAGNDPADFLPFYFDGALAQTTTPRTAEMTGRLSDKSIKDLGDVASDIDPVDGQALVWNASNNRYEPTGVYIP